MTKKALLLVLNGALFAIAMCASPPQEGQEALGMGDISRSTGDTAQPSSRGEVTRKSRGSLAPLAFLSGGC